MVFASVDPAIKEKVLSAYLAGHGRNQITREMHGLGIKVSHGSISNIINAYKRKHEQSSQLQVYPESRTSNAGTVVDINNIDSPLLMTRHDSGTGQAITTTNNSNSNVVTPRNGAPLSHLFFSIFFHTFNTIIVKEMSVNRAAYHIQNDQILFYKVD